MDITSPNPLGRVLVVDDEVELNNALVETLLTQGYEARGYTNPREALEVLRREDFDLVLSDLMMPEMDGIALIKAALEIDSNVVPIMMTGQGTIQTAVDAMKAGAFDYVLKPFKMQTLAPVLTRALSTRRLKLENLQLRETVAIYELVQTIAFTLDSQTIVNKIADAALQQTDADEVSILLPTSDDSELYVAAVRGDGRQRLLGERVPRRQSISGWVANEGRPVMLQGEVQDPRFRPLWPNPRIRCAVAVPMQVANKVVGTININSLTRPRPFSVGQIKALTILASTAAAALESASLYSQVRRAEENYRSIFENAVEGIYQTTPDGKFLSANPAMAQILGYESTDELLRTVSDVTNDLYVDFERREEFKRLLDQHDRISDFEIKLRRKNDGTVVVLAESARAVRDEKGEVLYYEGIANDITQRKRSEAELRFQKTLLESQSEASIDGILVVSKEKRILSFNKRLIEQWNLPPEIGQSQPDSQVLEHVVGMVKDPWQFLARVDEIYQHPDAESRDEIELTDGRTFDRFSAPIRSADDEDYGRVWFFRDISERKQAVEALRQSQERYRDLVENAHDIIYSYDLNGNYTSVNSAGERITGYTREENLSLTVNEILAPEYRDIGRAMLEQMLTGEKQTTSYQVEVIAKDAHRVFIDVNEKLAFQDGVPVGVQGIARDISERRQLEDQLRQSQKMEAIGRLAGGVAHDFNNLLTAINGYSSLALQRLEEKNPVRPFLEEIKKAGERAATLTRQLLAFGRKQILQPIPLNLNEVVTDMTKMLRRLIGEDVELKTVLAPDLDLVTADPGQIEQVLVNLVVNARDAMPQGGKLMIETAKVEFDPAYLNKHIGVQSGSYVMLAVSDSGIGMSEEIKKQIFEPFFTTKGKGKGTGLGLATVYGIVKQTGGHIWVYSEPGRGSTFKVYLPRRDGPVRPLTSVVVDETIEEGTETILLVEDEEVVRGLARKILQHAGYKVLEAEGGEQAIRMFRERREPIDLLLTDVVMPETSGKEVADRVSVMQPGIKVLFMSGYTDEAIVHHGVLDSNVEFIQKPFTPAALARKVREVIDSHGASPPPY